jgi:hypothetical protein
LIFAFTKHHESKTYKTISMKARPTLMAIAFIAITLIFSSCHKDISLPDESLSKLFGSWEWVETSGGLAGQVVTPASTGYTQSVEFSSKGIYKIYRNGTLQDKLKFNLSQGNSIFHSGTANFISYENPGLGNTDEDYIKESIRFGGEDTLFLNEECWDCYSYVYVRK